MIDLATHKRLYKTFEAFGYVTLVWGQIDFHLDVCNINLRDIFGLLPGWREIPAKGRLDSKLKFARAHITHSTLPVDVRQKGLLVIEDIDSLSEDRHWHIHGAADAISFPDSIRLARTHLHEKPTPLIEERHVTIANVLRSGLMPSARA